MNDIVKQLRIKAGVIEMGERIAFGSETSLMFKAANEIERLHAYIDHALDSSKAELIAKVEQQNKRIAELEKQLNPSLYWDAGNTEISHDSIYELMQLKFEDGAKVGDEVEIQRAALLPNKTYVFTVIDDGDYSCKYELKE